MTRFLLLIAALTFGLTLLFFNVPKISRAQTPRTDTIRFMAATRGTDFDGTGLKWCVSQTWHRGIPNSDLQSALDEVPQTATGCPSSSTEQVELAAYGLTNDASCTLSAPCKSLHVEITSGIAKGQCNYIAATLYDESTANARGTTGDLKGTQRMLHSRGPSGYPLTLSVTSGVWYSSGNNWTTVGTVVDDVDCMTQANPPQPGFDPGKYHVHQDFIPPTTSGSCGWSKNTSTNFATGTTDRGRNDPITWYIYSLSHTPGLSCFAEGPPKVADNLLALDGVLDGDGNGGGTRALATGAQSSLTSPQTCITGTSWCGTISVTPPVVQAAFSNYLGLSPTDYLRAQQKRIPPRGSTTPYYWYGPDNGGFYFYVFWWRTYPDGSDYWDCGMGIPGAESYWAGFSSWTSIHTCQNGDISLGGGGGPVTAIESEWSQFRGLNGINPTAPPTQQDANTWAQTQIDSGHWADVVKAALDAVIRAGAGNVDMATLGITGDPPFDGNLGDVGLAGVMNLDTVASRITGPVSSNWARDDMKRDWINSTRLRWNLTRKASR